MNVIVTGRNVEVTDALKKYAGDKIRKFDKFDANITEASFVFSLEKFRHRVEASLKVNGQLVQAESTTEEMYSSIDEVLDKLGRRLKKLKGKTDAKRKGEDRSIKSVSAAVNEEVEEESPSPRMIIRAERFEPKPMTAEEAADQLDVLKNEFFVFINSASNGLNVIYRRKDGHIGLIQPSV